MRVHRADNSKRAAQQEGGDLAPAGIGGEFEEDHLHAADGKAGNGRRVVVAVVYVEALQAEREYQNVGADE